MPDVCGVSIHDRPRDPVHDSASILGDSRAPEHHLAVFEAPIQLEQKAPIVNPRLMSYATRPVVYVEALA